MVARTKATGVGVERLETGIRMSDEITIQGDVDDIFLTFGREPLPGWECAFMPRYRSDHET